MKAITFILVCLFITGSIFAQPVSQQWAKRYDGTANSLDYSYALTLDASGNVLVVGYCTNNGTSKDIEVIKYDPNGQVLWNKYYDGAIHGGDYGFAIATDASSNVYVTGRSDSGPTSSDITTLKYNSSGDLQWASLYDGTGHAFDEGKCISVDPSGNVIVSGRSTNASGDQDIVVILYNSSGAEQWVQRYNGPASGYDAVNSMAVDNSGNIYVAGESFGNGADYIVIKYNSAGAQQWLQRYNGPNNGGDVAVSVKLDAANNVYVTGLSDGGAATSYDFATFKFNSAGVQQWLKRYDNPSHSGDFATAMAVSASGDVYITGITTNGALLTDSNYATIKYNTNGDLQWVANYLGPNNASDVPRSITIDNGGNVYVTGSSFIAPDLDDYATIKYNSAGGQEWVMTYNGPANSNDYSSSIAIDANKNVYVTGRSTGTNTSYDFATIKYGQLTGIEPVNGNIPNTFSLYQNYPNPFNPTTNIKFDIPSASEVALKVFDVNGKEVLTAYNGFTQAGSYEISLNTSSLSSGAYFYRINAGNYTDTKKMILVK